MILPEDYHVADCECDYSYEGPGIWVHTWDERCKKKYNQMMGWDDEEEKAPL